ncbi:MAG: hypothetical protein QXN26_03875 [Thermoplasmataceae archaeon]
MNFQESFLAANNLDMELVIVNEGNFPIETFSRDHDLFIPALLSAGNGKVSVMYYFSEAAVRGKRDVEIFLNRYGARNNEGILTLYASSSRYPQYNTLQRILDIPSVLNYASYVWKGKHYFHFIFRHEFLRHVSDTLLSSDVPSGMNLHRLSRNDRMGDVLRWIDEHVELYEVTFDTAPPVDELSPEKNPIGMEWIREIKYRTTDNSIRAVYFSKSKEVSGNALKIVENIYEIQTSNDMLGFLSSREHNIMIPSFRRIHTLSEGIFTVTLILPRSFVSDYIKKIARSRKDFLNWNVKIRNVRPLSAMLKKSETPGET